MVLNGTFCDNDPDSITLLHDSHYYDPESFANIIKERCPSHHFTLFNTNARSLVKHKSEYDVLFKALSDYSNFDFDLISFTETWLNSELESLVNFDGYTSVTKHKSPNKEGDGIAAYIKDNIQFRLRNDLNFPVCKESMYDGIFIEVINHSSPTQTNTSNTLIFIIYRSPSQNSINELIADLNIVLEKVKQENKTVVITGDLNIDLLKYNTDNQTTQFVDMLISNNLTPRVTLPTRITNTSATLIDHMFSNADSNKSIAGTLKTDIADHYCNFIFLDSNIDKSKHPKLVTYRKQDKKIPGEF